MNGLLAPHSEPPPAPCTESELTRQLLCECREFAARVKALAQGAGIETPAPPDAAREEVSP